jgi:hypothetical protein
VLDDAKIYRAEDPFKSERIKQLFADAPEILGFWTDHFHECLDAEVRDDVKRILLEAKSEGLSAKHIQALKNHATPSNFIGDGTLGDGINYID